MVASLAAGVPLTGIRSSGWLGCDFMVKISRNHSTNRDINKISPKGNKMAPRILNRL